MAGLFSAFGDYGWVITILEYVAWAVGFLIIALAATAFVVFVVVKGKEKRIYEIDMVNRKVKTFDGKEKKNRSMKKLLYISKMKKFLPKLQQKDIFIAKKKEVVFMIKDDNGLHHTARLPSQKELQLWYHAVHGIDLKKEVKKITDEEGVEEKRNLMEKIKDEITSVKKRDALNIIGSIYLLPNPSEDMEWLADQQTQANNQFKVGLLKHPLMAWGMTLAGCIFFTIIWYIITKKM